jgi:hypothetical protein
MSLHYLVLIAVAFARVMVDSAQLQAAVTGDRSHEFIYDWTSLGSGCKGQQSVEGGDVSLKLNPWKQPSLNRFQLRFNFQRFKLQSPVPKDQGKTNLEFARDCAIRVALNPPKGKRIADVEAVANYRLSKELSSEMKTLAQLTLGMTTLATTKLEFPAAEALKDDLKELRLVPQKLLGVDLLFYINRPDEKSKVDMSLQDHVMDVVVDLEECE